MARTLTLSRNFDLGFVSDRARDELGQNAALRMYDWIPQLEAPLRKRGGWKWGSPTLTTLGGAATSVEALGYVPFDRDPHFLAVSNSGSIYQLKQLDGGGGALVTDTGDTSIVPSMQVFFHKTGTIEYGIILAGLPQVGKNPKKYLFVGPGYESHPLGGTPPQARIGLSWGDYLVLANYYDPSSAFQLRGYRMAFSAVGNPDSWTLSGVSASTWDFPEWIIAALPVRNAILVWGYDNCHILTGDTPPPGGNLARKILFTGNGTCDGNSVVSWKDYAIWANTTGVFQSDGSTLSDLTSDGGISVRYRQVISGFNQWVNWKASGGIYRDHYVLTIWNPLLLTSTTFVCDLVHKTWTEWTNIPATMFARRSSGFGSSVQAGDEELLFGHRSSAHIAKISPLWMPGADNALDADGAAVLPALETPYYTMDNDALKRIRNVYVKYDLADAGAHPHLAVTGTTDPAVGATYDVPGGSLAATTGIRRGAVGVRRRSLGVGFRIAQTGASANTRIYSIESEGHPLEQSH